MKKVFYFAAFALLTLFAISCKSEVVKKAKETKQQIETVSKVAKSMSNLEDASSKMEKDIEKLKEVEPITSDAFKKWMPENLGDLKRSSYEFTTMMGNVANLEFKSDSEDEEEQKSIHFTILDGAGEIGATLFATQSFFSGMMDAYDSETEEKKEQLIERKGVKALETYYKQRNNSEIKTTVDGRFFVDVNAKGMNLEETWELIEKLRIEKLK